VKRPCVFSLDDLAREFEVTSTTAVLECAGNGRALFDPPVPGAQWRQGAVGCARWTGVRMADVLAHAELNSSAIYTAHHSPDRLLDASIRPALSRGLPLAKALSPETLLAWAMNGEPLHPLHGGPLRIVAPGYPGSAWQKWIDRLEVRDREHDGEKMTGTDYRMPVPSLSPGDVLDAARFQVLTDMPVKSLITFPADGFKHDSSLPLEVRGFAWSGHVPVSSVSISTDGGSTWSSAELAPATERFAWRRFNASLEREPGVVTVIARAMDEVGCMQPLGSAPWNPRGYCNNTAHSIRGIVL
jgi:sulfite oxidase